MPRQSIWVFQGLIECNHERLEAEALHVRLPVIVIHFLLFIEAYTEPLVPPAVIEMWFRYFGLELNANL